MVKQTNIHTNNNSIQAEAVRLRATFVRLNDYFRKVHIAISDAKPWDKNDMETVKTLIFEYMVHYRNVFPKRVIPKQHILEHHCLQFMRMTGFKLGLLGEQGTELSHQSIGRLSSRVLSLIKETDKLKFIMKAHILNVSPTIFSSSVSKWTISIITLMEE